MEFESEEIKRKVLDQYGTIEEAQRCYEKLKRGLEGTDVFLIVDETGTIKTLSISEFCRAPTPRTWSVIN